MQSGGAAYRTSVKETFSEHEMDVSAAGADIRAYLNSEEPFIGESLRASLSLNGYVQCRFINAM
jgi:hypothetical protein